MKTAIHFILLFLGINCSAQNYILDNTFGINGIKTGIVNSFTPINGELINNNYYINSANKITKIDYNGNVINNFGTNGFISLNNSTKTYQISNLKFLNGYFYIYGKVTTNNDQDIFIYKIDENGNADNTFGTDGMITIDFGYNEIISDFLIESDESLLCIGNQYFPSTINSSGISSKIIYFKLNNNGTVNYNYDSNGFKFYSINVTSITMIDQTTEVKSIYPFNGKYLLAGSYSGYQRLDNNLIPKHALLLTTIDNSGNIDPSYGNSGYRLSTLNADGSKVIRDIQKVDDNLYVKYYYTWSFNNQGTKILKYNLNTNQSIFNIETMYDTYLKAESGNFFISGSDKCFGSTCLRKFELKKIQADGNLDTSFNSNGGFSYRFPNNLYEDVSSMHIKDTNGKIMIAGLSNNYFSIVRIQQSNLGNGNFIKSDISISPNPFYDKIKINSDVNIKSIEIIDFVGRKIDAEFIQIDSNTYSLLPKTSNSGIHLLKITSIDNKVTIKKIIKN